MFPLPLTSYDLSSSTSPSTATNLSTTVHHRLSSSFTASSPLPLIMVSPLNCYRSRHYYCFSSAIFVMILYIKNRDGKPVCFKWFLL